GLTFYSQALANGRAAANGEALPFPSVPAYTIEQIAVGILDGATGADAETIANKVVAASNFTAALDTPDELAAYAGDEAAAFGRAYLADVTDDDATIPNGHDAV